MSYRESNGRGGFNEVSTGPPSAKHRDHANSFKFGGPSTGSNPNIANVLVLSAPLPVLFESTVTFRLTYADSSKNLISKCMIHKMLRVNDTQWLILNLDPDNYDSNNKNKSPERERVYQSSASRISTASSSVGDQPPTLRLKLRLEGPYRPEIAASINLANSWFGAVDIISDITVGTASAIVKDIPTKIPAVKLLLVPAVPVATIAVACLPILGGVLILGIPFFLPVLLLVFAVAASLVAVGSALYFSTREGRMKLFHVVDPAYQTFLMTKTGQRMIYDVGPRPSPQTLARAVLPTDLIGKLIVSLLIDFVGSASYLLPLVGEGFDLTWAPVSMILVGALYDDIMPNLKYVAFIEELLPFTDWIPSATMGWVKEFGPGIFEEGRRRAMDAKVVGRREREALVNVTR